MNVTTIKRVGLILISGMVLTAGAAKRDDLRISIGHGANSEVQLQVSWDLPVESNLQIWSCTNLQTGGWAIAADEIATAGVNNVVWSDGATTAKHRFYYAALIDVLSGVDADGDQLDDTWEELHQMDPTYMNTNFDLDGDKLTNLQEFQIGTNPNSAHDHNQNGIPDDWETFYKMVGGPDDDPDGDGLTNAEEFYYGTDPNVSTVDQFGIVRYSGEVYDNGEYCYSVVDEKSTDPTRHCLQMSIVNNHRHKATFRFGSANTVIVNPGYYIVFKIRADRLVNSSYPLTLFLNWSSDSVTLDVMSNLFVSLANKTPVDGIGFEYVTCKIRLPDTFRQFRDFSLLYDTSVGDVQRATFFVTDIAVMNADGAVVSDAEVLDERHVMIKSDQVMNIYSARDVANHLLVDGDGNEIELQNIGVRSWVDGFYSDRPIVGHYTYLQLPEGKSLVPGMEYTYTSSVRNKWILPPDQPTIRFSYDDQHDISSSIKINQVGYLPDSLKYCYVGNYLGDFGEMPVTARQAVLRRQDGSVAGTFPLVKSDKEDLFRVSRDELKPFSGEEVWIADFSGYKTAGTYYIQIDGIGRSYPFEIGDSIYNVPFYHTARVFYYQRSGVAIEEQYAGQWTRPVSHTMKSIYHNSVADKSGLLYDPEVEPAIGEEIDLTGGWYDAADYNKYTKSAAEAVNCMLSLYELAPEKYSCDSLNIPESGNGIPDIIDQAKWELDWLAKMVSANGGVFNKNSFSHFAFVMPQERNGEKMYAITKTTRDTALACAVLAKAARIFNANGWYPEAAATYEAKARLAWECLLRVPQTYPVPAPGEHIDAYQSPVGRGVDMYGDPMPTVGTGPYYQTADDFNARAWAALEMYELTGDHSCYIAFRDKVDELSDAPFLDDLENIFVKDWWHGTSNPILLYPIMKYDEAHAQAVRAGIERVISVYQKGYDQWRYAISMKNTLTSVNFGGFSMSSRWSVYYILFYELLGREELLELAKQNLDVQMGANPLSITYITGIGSKYPMRPHAKICEYDGIEEPIPGFSVYGCAHSLIEKGYYTVIMNNAYPRYQGNDPSVAYYPSTRKFVDAWEPVKMGEFVIENLSHTAMAIGYFSNPDATYQP
jgi:endoglucanase